jgi:hypothetical protein
MRTLRIGALLTVTVVLSLSLLAACNSGGGGSGNKAAFCNVIKKANADKSVKGSSADAKAKTVKLYDNLVASAPSDISADVKTLRDTFAKVAKDPNFLDKDTATLAKAVTATKHLRTYSKDKCKVDMSKS